MILELDEKEIEVLPSVLKSFDAELRDEIGDTDDRGYKAALHGEEDVIKRLLEKVSSQKA
ncbi:MAG: hypothetical protein ACLPN1_13000 [Dissulfurispiraceae bacterium]|jgi:hypothetical protein